MGKLKDPRWINAALTRAVKTFAQTALSMIGGGVIGLFDIDWINVLGVAGAAGVISLLTSLAGLPEVDDGERDDEEG